MAVADAPNRRHVIPIVLALVVLACALPLAWMGATPITHACDEPVSNESSQAESHASLWPPGVRCAFHLRGGNTIEETYITWYELTMAMLAAAAVWLASAATLRTESLRRLLLGAGAVVFLFVAANVAFLL